MIRFLSIRDLAIVDAMDIELDHGFNVLTGETGAGKSIIIGALGLLVGGRGGADLVRTGASRALVQATFETEEGEENIVRREIPAQGRGRIFIDDALATASALRRRSAGGSWTSTASTSTRPSSTRERHVGLLDAYGGLEAAASEVAAAYDRWRSTEVQLEAEREGAREAAARIEFLQFQLEEIDSDLAPQPGEDELLRNERRRLANADRLLHLASEAYAALYERDDSVVSSLGVVWRQLEELAALDSAFVEHAAAARETVPPLLDDLAHALRSYAAGVEVSPDRLGEVETRLAAVERLARKYGGTLDAVLERRTAIAAEIRRCTDGETRRAALESEAVARAGRVPRRGRRAVDAAREAGAVAGPRARSRAPAVGHAQRTCGGRSSRPDSRRRALGAARHRPGGALPVRQPRRGRTAPRTGRLGRGALARDAGPQDAGRDRHPGQDARLR